MNLAFHHKHHHLESHHRHLCIIGLLDESKVLRALYYHLGITFDAVFAIVSIGDGLILHHHLLHHCNHIHLLLHSNTIPLPVSSYEVSDC